MGYGMKDAENLRELWVITRNGIVQCTPGGSSTKSRLMVYTTHDKARSCLRFCSNPEECRVTRFIAG